jgi:hemerythrin superfamily protein
MTLPSTGDIVDVLRFQHTQIKEAFADVARSNDGAKAPAFANLQAMLLKHEMSEQQVVHPVTRDVVGETKVAEHRVEEENHATTILDELNDLGVGHPEFDARFDEFRRDVLAHAEREEAEEFPRLRATQPAGALRAMADQFRTAQLMV